MITDKQTHEMWKAQGYTVKILEELKNLKLNCLNQAASFTETDKTKEEIIKWLIKAKAVGGIIDRLEKGEFPANCLV